MIQTVLQVLGITQELQARVVDVDNLLRRLQAFTDAIDDLINGGAVINPVGDVAPLGWWAAAIPFRSAGVAVEPLTAR